MEKEALGKNVIPISGIDLYEENCAGTLIHSLREKLGGRRIDLVIFSAGYFTRDVIQVLDFVFWMGADGRD